MPDDLEVMKTGIEAVASSALKPVNDLITSIFGPAAEEAGLMLRDHVRIFRASRQLRLYKRAAEILREASVTPQQVPLKLLFPIIENASIEESDELQDRWANLLARAADPKDSDNISIAFPEMLRELSSRQVKFLDALYDYAQQEVMQRHKTGMVQVSFGYTDLLYSFSVTGLARFPVCSPRRLTAAEWDREEVKADDEEIGLAMDMFIRHSIFEVAYELPERKHNSIHDPELDSGFQFTRMGIRFVEGCREPTDAMRIQTAKLPQD